MGNDLKIFDNGCFYFNSCEIMVLWVFGYGSLVWNFGFEYDEKVIGYIKNYKRVFDLGKCFRQQKFNNLSVILDLDLELDFIVY